MCSGPSTSWPSMASSPAALLCVLLDAACGSLSVRPSPPPSRLTEDQERTRSARLVNIGASALLSRVSPVLPSQPAQGTPRAWASSPSAVGCGPGLGVKATSGQPARNAAYAYSELAGSGERP